MIKVTPIQTGTVSIRPHHHCGDEGKGPIRRKIDMLLDKEWVEDLPIFTYLIEHPEGNFLVDSGDTAENSAKDYLPSWHPFLSMVLWSKLHQVKRLVISYGEWA